MSKKVKSYIESHWSVFVAKGVIALIAGFYLTFYHAAYDLKSMSTVIAATLLALGAIEFLNIISHKRHQSNLVLVALIALLELLAGFAIMFSAQIAKSFHLHDIQLVLFATYTLIYGLFTIILGFTSFKNLTNRFIFIFVGMLSCIVAFSILGGQLNFNATFIRLFGTYLMFRGYGDCVYGVHSRDQKLLEKAHN